MYTLKWPVGKMAALQTEPILTELEKAKVRIQYGEDFIRLVERQVENGLRFREENWLHCSGSPLQNTCQSTNQVTVVLIGLGGVGKSTLGNVLTGLKDGFKASSSATAETLECKLQVGGFEGKTISVLDTPGYVLKDLMKGRARYNDYKKTLDCVSEGINMLGEGAHVFIFVMNAADPRNRALEVEIMEKTKALNAKSNDHCMLVVTHASTQYNGKNIGQFLEDARKSDVFRDFLPKVKNRVVLVELACSSTGGGDPCVKEIEQAQRMVLHMAYTVIESNLSGGIIYKSEIMKQEIKKGCFPACALIWTPNGKKLMSDLQLEDEVLVANQLGQTKYERVIMFSHAARDEVGCFMSISTEDGKVMRLSPGHLVHVGQVGQLKPARDVKTGDVMFTCGEAKQEAGTVRSVKVTEVSNEWFTAGIFCPYTPSGSIIVDGLLASCYTDLMSPTLAHTLMFPVRTLHRVLPEDWFVWLMPYNSDQGVPKVLWSIKKMFPSLTK